MTDHYDVIVVGVGTMGASTCYHLARRGVRVLGLEQFDIPHGRGSHHGHSRVIRLVYFEHPDYVTLLRRSYENWRDLEAESGQKLLYLTGGLYLGHPDGSVITKTVAVARGHGLNHQLLDRNEMASRYPQFHLTEDFVGFFEPDAGFVTASRAVATFAHQALCGGAELHGHEPVLDWEESSGGVTVNTPKGRYRADTVVFCGGAWSSRLLGDLGVKLTVTRQVMVWVWPRDPASFQLGQFPIWCLDRSSTGPFTGVHYGFPMIPDEPGLKLALHFPGTLTDPDCVVHEPADGDEETIRPLLRQIIPDGDGPLLAIRPCLYTSTPDSHFIVDRHPQRGRAVVACGFSGHGFKFAAVMGEVLADLVTTGRSELPLDLFSLSRFSS